MNQVLMILNLYKSINIDGIPDDDSRASAIIIYQQSAYVNLKIENKSLIVTKTY